MMLQNVFNYILFVYFLFVIFLILLRIPADIFTVGNNVLKLYFIKCLAIISVESEFLQNRNDTQFVILRNEKLAFQITRPHYRVTLHMIIHHHTITLMVTLSKTAPNGGEGGRLPH